MSQKFKTCGRGSIIISIIVRASNIFQSTPPSTFNGMFITEYENG